MTKRSLFRAAGFLLALALCFGMTNHVLGSWDVCNSSTGFETFYELPANTADIIWIGPSSVQDGIIPAVFYKTTGTTLYNLSTPAMRFSSTIFLMREAEKTQDPKLYVVDLRCFAVMNQDYYIHLTLDNMRPSANWLDAVQYIVNKLWEFHPETKADMLSYYIPFYLYHSRWNQLYKEDFVKADTICFGCVLNHKHTQLDEAEAKRKIDYLPPMEPSAENMCYLEDMLDFCDTFDKKVIFADLPHSMGADAFARIRYAEQIVRDRGYEVWDMNRELDAIGLDYGTDFGDANHANVWGAQKISGYAAQQLSKQYDLPDHRGDQKYQIWADDQAHFEKNLAETELKRTTDWNEYLDRLLQLNPERYTIFMAVRGSQGQYLDAAAAEKLKALGFDTADRLLDGQNHAFLGIRDGEYCYQDIGEGEEPLSHSESLNNQQIRLNSSTASASIRLGVREYSKNRNGFNIVVEDVLDGELVDSVTFDLSTEKIVGTR